jgi:cardiolipin synthase
MNIATTRGSAKSSLSLPNILTYARIAAIPVVVGCIYVQAIMDGPLWLRWVALAVFIAAGVTDFLDGYYARIWDQHSAFGRMLDPIADKLLVASCLLMLAADGIIHGWTLWAAIVILCREILVSRPCGSACPSQNSPNGRPRSSWSRSDFCWPARLAIR